MTTMPAASAPMGLRARAWSKYSETPMTEMPAHTEGAPADLAALWLTHHVQMTRLARLLVDDLQTAEDVVQDAFLAMHRRSADLRDPAAAPGYLRQAVVNGARSALRRRRTVRNHLRVAEPDLSPLPEDQVVLTEEHHHVWAAVQTLPPRQREVITLRYWSDLSEAEIADALDISRGTVKSQASKALKTISAMLGGEQ